MLGKMCALIVAMLSNLRSASCVDVMDDPSGSLTVIGMEAIFTLVRWSISL
jgi:hypothetical protein